MNLTQQYANYEFESSSATTPEFAAFARKARAELASRLKNEGLELQAFNRGHFYISGFIFNPHTNKYAYFSLSDVRHFGGVGLDNVLIRTASHIKDYTGGSNNYTHWDQIGERALQLTGGN